MGLSHRIMFQPAATGDGTPRAARFGGQPDWIEAPQWPLSRATGKPMQFIGQIPLAPPLFTGRGGAMAYVFITDDDDGTDGTWEPDGGENAVVVQPGRYAGPVAEEATGPTLYAMVERPGHDLLQAEPVVFTAETTATPEPAPAPPDTRDTWSDAQETAYAEALGGSKIGGVPLFLQYDEYRDGEEHGWKLLLQLDSTDAPFYINFGDAGVAYVFVNAAETEGRMLWQCG